jgi:hypothetical protein
MRFKTYLSENLKSLNVVTLKDIISTVSEKDIPVETKVDNGILFKLNLGGWANFKERLTQALLEKHWKNYSDDPNSLNFKNNALSLFVEYNGKIVTFFITDDLKYVPNEEEEK